MRTALVVSAALCGLVAVVSAGSGPIVQISGGQIEGQFVNGTRQFRGIPFGAPPTGPLRWKPPVPAASWSGVKDCSNWGNVCMQPPDAFTMFMTMSEDCLYLNVYAPANASLTNLPVMLFLYGGSWKYGSASFLVYDAVPDVSLLEDVIIVTANYRLGAFGFVASSALRTEDPEGGAGNYGIQDQRLAMKWVQENAAAFGGDKNNVMLFGESAGAGSVSSHLVNMRSKGLFHRAGMESGPLAPWTAQPFNTSEAKYMAIASNLGCTQQSPDDQLACMRAANATTLESATRHGLPSGFLEWSPVVDGVEFDDYPEKLAAKGQINHVPVLLGTNRDEGTLFTPVKDKDNQTVAAAKMLKQFGPEIWAKIQQVYQWSSYSSPFEMSQHVIGDAFMSCPARRSARWLSYGPNGQPVYLYFFNHVLEVIELFKPSYGCCHASELAFVFDLKVALWGKGEPTLAKQFMYYWTRFAANGDPNKPVPNSHAPPPPTMPEWPVYTNASDASLTLDVPVSATTGLKKTFCDFWDTIPLPPYYVFSGTTPPILKLH